MCGVHQGNLYCENAPNIDPAQNDDKPPDFAEIFPIPRGVTIGADV
jgi:hypothetical protein